MINLFMVVDCSSQLNFELLTKHRVPAAIPIFSKYRLIDISLSIAKYSNLTNVGVFCDRNYRSLQDHIGSGERYNLDRRRDGIFILPPKTSNPVNEDFLSFERMMEQDEYFRRSNQEYVVIVPSTLIFFTDLDTLLNEHIKSEKDISQLVSKNGERLFVFILKKYKLMEYIESYSSISFRNIVEVFDYSNSESKNTIIFNDNAKYLKNIRDYYETSMNFILDKTQKKYDLLLKLSTKEQLDKSSYFGEQSKVSNSLISTGCNIEGTVENSLISRRVVIKKNAKVVNSIIMNDTVIEEGSLVLNAILDKESLVVKNSKVEGTIKHPYISEKKQIITTSKEKKVAILTVECSPFIKRGGLADMVGSLVKELSRNGADTKVFVPLYKEIKEKNMSSFNHRYELKMEINKHKYQFNVYSIEQEKLTYYFIDLYIFFDRDEVYGYEDDAKRFSYFTLAAIKFISEQKMDIDIIHSHDWHTSLLPLLLRKFDRLKDVKTVLTIHNLNYQGETSKELLDEMDISYDVQTSNINLLEIGIDNFKEITTVSKTYAEELKYEYYSGGLRENILRRQENLYGIINGLSDGINPKLDLEIKERYSIDDVFDKKIINKEFLAKICGFNIDSNSFIIGSVSRINEIKGFDLIIDSLPKILENKNIFYCVLGVGNEYFKNKFLELEKNYKGRIKAFLEFDALNPSYIYSGADCFLMPSRIEPCGTSQMIALKYGTIPIVRQTGGLNDTIKSFDQISSTVNGFKFYNMDSRDLISSIEFAYNTYSFNKESWNALIKNAMKCKFSFEYCAKEYLKLYNKGENKYE